MGKRQCKLVCPFLSASDVGPPQIFVPTEQVLLEPNLLGGGGGGVLSQPVLQRLDYIGKRMVNRRLRLAPVDAQVWARSMFLTKDF